MDRSAFSPDGKTFYYVSNNTWFSTKDSKIQSYHFDEKKWVGPIPVIPQYYGPTLSIDGNTIYLMGGGRGVVKDFILSSPYEKINPMIIQGPQPPGIV